MIAGIAACWIIRNLTPLLCQFLWPYYLVALHSIMQIVKITACRFVFLRPYNWLQRSSSDAQLYSFFAHHTLYTIPQHLLWPHIIAPPKRPPPVLLQKLYSKWAPVLLCPFKSCHYVFHNLSGLRHKNSAHQNKSASLKGQNYSLEPDPVSVDDQQQLSGQEDDQEHTKLPALYHDKHPTLNSVSSPVISNMAGLWHGIPLELHYHSLTPRKCTVSLTLYPLEMPLGIHSLHAMLVALWNPMSPLGWVHYMMFGAITP